MPLHWGLYLLNLEGDVRTKCSSIKLELLSFESHKTFIQNSIKILPLLVYTVFMNKGLLPFFLNVQ